MKTKILCIIGRSGSGKTTIEALLHHYMPDLFQPVVSYTTRQMRDGEQDGVEHRFVGKEQMPPQDRMLAYTQYGDAEYWADKDMLDAGKINTYVIDVEGYRYLRHFHADEFDLRVMYVRRPVVSGIDLQRRQRDLHRMTLQPDDIDMVVVNDGDMDKLINSVMRIISDILWTYYHDPVKIQATIHSDEIAKAMKQSMERRKQ